MYVKFLRDLSLVLPHDEKEHKSRRVFNRILAGLKPDLFFDIGSNVGLYSWQAKRQEVPMILMFEADRDNPRLLAKTIKAHRMEGAFVLVCAMSDQTGISEYVEDSACGATGSLVDRTASGGLIHNAYGMGKRILTSTLNLDVFTDCCRDKTVLMKIDLQDAEGKISAGMESLSRL